MENIKINKVDVKPSGLVIVNYNEGKEATLNKKWQSVEVEFLKGLIGGCAYVTIEQKGQYTNITAVDMNSGVEANAHNPQFKTCKAELLTSKDIYIISQCLTKVWGANKTNLEPAEVLDAYRYFVLELENNG